MSLASIQRAIADAVRGDGPVSEELARYREQFFLRHVGALEEDFASVAHAVGHDEFHAVVRGYLTAHPPRSFSLRDLGRSFPAFLGDAFLRELARVEWAFVEAFDGPDAPPLDRSSLSAMPEAAWPGARIALAPSLQRLVLDYPAHDYRHAVRTGIVATRPEAKPTYVVVSRGPCGLRHTELEPLAFALLEELANGASLETACERVAPPREEIAGWFQRWTEAAWISAIYFPASLPPPGRG
jgi:hypothetical protein